MSKIKVFIDGSEGTTGLRINERFAAREDIELLSIDPELRKDPSERAKLINSADAVFLCLPDAAAREAVSLADNDHVVLIDSSTAHRVNPDWAYGFPELSAEYRSRVQSLNRIAVPGCHASGFIALVRPLTAAGVLPADYPLSAFSLTGYSGGGKKMIAQYEADGRDPLLDSPRPYGLTQKHKHLPEMTVHSGLSRTPLFTPVVADYYSGMTVSVMLHTDLLAKPSLTPDALRGIYREHYKGEPFITVMDEDSPAQSSGFFAGNMMSGFDDMEICVSGNDERILLTACFDNLGKGASGAAVECFNLRFAFPAEKGLVLKSR